MELVDGGKIVYGTQSCYCALYGKQRPGESERLRRCPNMGRTVGRGNSCQECGARRKGAHSSMIRTGEWRTCTACNGTAIVPEDRYDYIPSECLADIPLQVVRLDRDMTFNESLLGIGCITSCIDYGKLHDMADTDVITAIRAQLATTSVRACAVVDRADMLAEGIGICVNRGGYSLRAITPENMAQMGLELDYATGMRVGMRVYGAGGNGTIAGTGIYRTEGE